MMKASDLRDFLDISKRTELFERIVEKFERFGKIDHLSFRLYKMLEGSIPVITIGEKAQIQDVKYVKVFIGAQHNEFNGLFGIIEYLEMLENGRVEIQKIIEQNQVVIFFPLMNPYGFKNPSRDNKSGYYLKNGSNLNRFWRRIFVPDYEAAENDLIEYDLPEHTKIVETVLSPYWNIEVIPIYIVDFHETSLLERFPRDLSINLTVLYKR